MDVRSSIDCLRKIGVRIDGEPPEVTVYPFVYDTLKAGLQSLELNCGNSGTTARFLMGFLSAFGIGARISGDESLNRRPMKRAAAPLAEMGCRISLERGENLPEIVEPVPALSGIEWTMKTPSAQVKTAILFAGLRARGETIIRENVSTRNHTEIILKEAGADIHFNGDEIILHPLEKPLSFPDEISIPGDISTAAFFVTAAILLGGSELIIRRVLLNPHRAYYLDVLKRMGALIEIEHEYNSFGERAGDLRIVYDGRMKGIEISGEETVKCIDEIPALAVAAAFAKGRSVFRDLQELRVKESDRLKALEFNLQKMGVEVQAAGSSLEINGRSTAVCLDAGMPVEECKGDEEGKVEIADPPAELDSFGDHRIAMAMKIASLVVHRDCYIKGGESAAVSAPRFYADLERLLVERRPANIFLAGFMGAGKTTIGKLLAKELDYSFIDLDERVRTTAGKPIWRIFTEDGEDRFRELEKKELMSLAGINRTVVALGGGTTCDFENTTFIYKMGLVILLAAPYDILYARIKDEPARPLSRNEEDFYALFNRRNIIGCYETADFIIDTSRDNPSLIAKSLKKILHHWRERQTGPDSKPRL
jgi:3-phosphoshikimate 1-carboxyvinyltransferase